MREDLPVSTHHHHHHRQENRAVKFLRAYRFEVIWLAIVLLGIFLVLEQIDFRAALLRWLTFAGGAALEGIDLMSSAVFTFIGHTTVADAIGYLLILGAVVAVLLRIRWRLMRAPSLTSVQCPRCRSDLHRVHRQALDHAINWYVPVRRYQCTNRECNWRGLRVGESIHRLRSAPTTRQTSPE